MSESEYVPLSAINQYSYCARRCALIHVEAEFEENRHTLAGTHHHSGVDIARHRMSEGVRLELAMPVWSHRLRVSGRCDVVEFHDSGEIVPVEYKLGKRQRWVNDDLQVTAQALCLEEMLGRPVLGGAIYHQKSRRLRKVELDARLRQEAEMIIGHIHALINGGLPLPPPTDQLQRCGECSLHDICQPEMWRAVRATQRIG